MELNLNCIVLSIFFLSQKQVQDVSIFQSAKSFSKLFINDKTLFHLNIYKFMKINNNLYNEIGNYVN